MADSERLLNKIEKIDERLSSIDTSLIRNTLSLEEHVRRTNALENELKPVKKHVLMVEAVFKIIGIIAVGLGILESIHQLWK